MIVDWFALSDAALRVLDPGQQPILWPEHFDVAILLDNHSYGSSPGDDFHPIPYMYVSAHDHDSGSPSGMRHSARRDARIRGSIKELVAFWRRAERCCGGLAGPRSEPLGYSECRRIHGDH